MSASALAHGASEEAGDCPLRSSSTGCPQIPASLSPRASPRPPPRGLELTPSAAGMSSASQSPPTAAPVHHPPAGDPRRTSMASGPLNQWCSWSCSRQGGAAKREAPASSLLHLGELNPDGQGRLVAHHGWLRHFDSFWYFRAYAGKYFS